MFNDRSNTMSDTVPGSAEELEIICGDFPRGDFQAAIFDFDGTLSLLRRNWQDVMIPMMVNILSTTRTSESREQLRSLVENFVMRLNGRQTIYQMIQLSDEVRQRGHEPKEPIEYKNQYHELLWQEVSQRIEAIQSGETPPDEMTVPGSRSLLEGLVDRGVTLYLASGTDLKYVRDEVQLLGLHDFFGPRIYGALDDYKKFSKAMVIERIIGETQVDGSRIVGFGDGFVEIEEVKKVGGLSVGVASDENARQGVNPWKRERLIQAGADMIIGDYRHLDQLFAAMDLTGS